MKNELIEYHRKRADWNFAAARATSDSVVACHHMTGHAFHARAVAWLESLPQSVLPTDAAVAALEKASA